MRVLVVDGDLTQANDIESMLAEVNITCAKVGLGEDGLDAMMAERFDCVVLSSHLPDMTAEQFLVNVPPELNMPIVYVSSVPMGVTEKVRVLHKVDALIVRPFKKTEIINKVAALIDPYEQQSDDKVLYYYKLSLNTDTLNVSFANKTLPFNEIEAAILEVLMRNPDELVSNEDVRQNAFGGDGPTDQEINTIVDRMSDVLYQTTGHRYLQTIGPKGHRLWHPPWMRAMPLDKLAPRPAR